jgi:spermidine synthase
MNRNLALALSALSGFIALSYEILWFRTYGFLTEGSPQAFSDLMAAYLFGLTGGAFLSYWLSREDTAFQTSALSTGGSRGLSSPYKTAEITAEDQTKGRFRRQVMILGVFIIGANLTGFLTLPAIAEGVHQYNMDEKWALPLFAAVAALLGTTFPLIAHFAIPPNRATGQRLSHLYAANIMGSTAGSLLTGLIALDHLSLQTCSVVLALGGLLLGGALIYSSRTNFSDRLITAAMVMLIGLHMVLQSPLLFDRVYEKLLYGDGLSEGKRFQRTIENAAGVVNVSPSGTVYGGGSYDGHFNTNPDPRFDDNRSLRAYLVPSIHPTPREILMIGLGSASWLQILAEHPTVERVVVVEINPAYVDAARNSEIVASSIDHPKVEIVIGDGRRYLNAHQDKFDVIINNTIAYWRSHATNLLSRDYLELAKRHLKPRGIVYWNSTKSIAAQKSGAVVFPYLMRFQNMLIGSNHPINVNKAHWIQDLIAWRINGQFVLPRNTAFQIAQDVVAESPWKGEPPWESRDEILERLKDVPVITDDNMITEWSLKDTFP